MDRVSLASDSWSVDGVGFAVRPLDRLRGVNRGPGRILLRTRSVHGFGLAGPLLALGITRGMEVRIIRELRPGRVAFFPGCRYVLELPMTDPVPQLGTRLELRRG